MLARFEDLSQADQVRIRAASGVAMRLAAQYALPVLIHSETAQLRSASGCVFELPRVGLLATAHHVYSRWRELESEGQSWKWQVLNSPIDPLQQLAYEDESRDLVFFDLSRTQRTELAEAAYRPIPPWPPTALAEGDHIIAAGYPAFERLQPGPLEIGFGCVSSSHRVTRAGEHYAVCQFEREHWITAPGARPLPEPGLLWNGLSGGPVLRLDSLAIPIVGIVSEFHDSFELMRLQTFAGVSWLADVA